MKKISVLTLATATLLAGAASSRAADVQENWTKHCAACHGKDGKGETKAGKKAEVKDLTDAKLQASLSDEQVFNQIKDGMKDKNGKERMKPFASKLSDEEMKALVAHARSLKK
jgi:cytochrome c6